MATIMDTNLDISIGEFIAQMSIDDYQKMRDHEWCDKFAVSMAGIIRSEYTHDYIRIAAAQHGLIMDEDEDIFRLSIELGKFYVQIAHMYALIQLLQKADTDVYKAITPIILTDEVNMDALYYDQAYNNETDVFESMSTAAIEAYQKDLRVFYSAYTGHQTMPYRIRRFVDIDVNDIQSSEALDTNEEDLLHQYAVSVRNASLHTQLLLDELVKIQNVLIIENDETYINPTLTSADLCKLVHKIQEEMVQVYVTIKEQLINCDQLFEAYIEQTILESGVRQLTEIS